MRFMVMVKSDSKAEAGVLPDEKILAEMGKYNEELIKAGVMLAGEGLKASSQGSLVRISGRKATVIDGPFTEAKELVAGFWLIQVKSKQEAIEWLKRAPFKEGEIELRPLFELSDFPVDAAEKSDGWREQEQRFRDGADAMASAGAQPPRKPGTKRFMILLKGDKNTESDMLPDEKSLAAMGALMEETARTGALLSGEGLQPSSKGARIKYSGDKRTVIDGPFTETKELIAGFSMIQVKSKQEANEFARRMLQIHVEGTHIEEGVVEVREVFELEDFPVSSAEKPDGWRQQEQAFRDRPEK